MRHLLLPSILLLTVSSSALAQDAVVPDDFATIQAAVNAAADVDQDGTIEILVRAGTHAGPVRIQRSNLLLEGEGADRTTIQGNGTIEAVRVQDAANVVLRAFLVTNQGTQDGIELSRTTACRVELVSATACLDGIVVNRSSGAVVTQCESFANASDGLQLSRSVASIFADNSCHDNASHGIDVNRSQGSSLERNRLDANGSAGLRIVSGQAMVVSANSSNSNLSDGYRLERVAASTLVGNTASGNRDNGLRTRGTAGNLYTQNTLVQNGEYGVRRRDWSQDDWDASQAGIEAPAGDNDLSGNQKGAIRED